MSTGMEKPYAQLVEIHKLVEELRAENQDLRDRLSALETNIDQHYEEIYSKKEARS